MPGDGLSGAEAARRLADTGPNELPRSRGRSPLRHLLSQITHAFALMLWVGSALAYLAGLPQLAIAIIVVILLNAAFAYVQESRADRAAERLRHLLPERATVWRDGRRCVIDAREVVVDDILLIAAGDRIAADARLIDVDDLHVDESLLTGESVPVSPGGDDIVFAGTYAVSGRARARVQATGPRTRMAGIAALASRSHPPKPPLARELRRVVWVIASISLGIGLAFFAVTLAMGGDPRMALIFGVGVTVALVPEALLPTVTLTLALGAERMARQQVLITSLESVETLGSVTWICTDKTGTITSNHMSVQECWVASTAEEPALLTAAVLASEDIGEHGDPLDIAIGQFASSRGLDPDRIRRDHPMTTWIPFTPERRRTLAITEGLIAVKGAPEAVLALTGVDQSAIVETVRAWTDRGLRVLAVAGRFTTEGGSVRVDDAETGLHLLGLIGCEDPPRDGVTEALEQCRRYGISVAMLTGDHPRTARAIADEVGLRGPDDPVIVGADLPEDDDALARLFAASGVVVARVTPEDKLRIARVLQQRGEVVAMTGDGVNDAPALTQADIGVAMGLSGTDVARAASDVVILDDHFATIVTGIEYGRTTYANIRRFLAYHFTDNVAELTPFVVWALSQGSIPLALGVLQVLALDIATDTLSATALGAEPRHASAHHDRPARGRLVNRTVLLRSFGIFGPLMAAISMLAFLATYWSAGWRPGEEFPGGQIALAASGAAFLTVVLAQIANAFACRSFRQTPWQLGWLTNRLLVAAVGVALLIALVMLAWNPIAELLGQALPGVVGGVIAVASMPVLLAVDALVKWRVLRRARRLPGQPRRHVARNDAAASQRG